MQQTLRKRPFLYYDEKLVGRAQEAQEVHWRWTKKWCTHHSVDPRELRWHPRQYYTIKTSDSLAQRNNFFFFNTDRRLHRGLACERINQRKHDSIIFWSIIYTYKITCTYWIPKRRSSKQFKNTVPEVLCRSKVVFTSVLWDCKGIIMMPLLSIKQRSLRVATHGTLFFTTEATAS